MTAPAWARSHCRSVSSAARRPRGNASPRIARRFAQACLLALAGLAAAEGRAQAPARGAYLGVGLADLRYEIVSDGVEFIDASTASFKIYSGFRLSRHWEFEAAYQITAEDSHAGTLAGSAIGTAGAFPVEATVQLELVTLRALRSQRYAWGQAFVAFGVSGAAVDSEVRAAQSADARFSLHTTKNGLTVGLGAQWDFAALSLRLAYDWWDADMHAVELALHRGL